MPRAATTTDAFNAIAEPRRRQLIELLAQAGGRARAVNDLVDAVGLPQPAGSKHLGVLRKVGLVSVSKQGQHRLYRLNPEELKPVYAWIKEFERFWENQTDRIKARAERLARERAANSAAAPPHAFPDKRQET